MEARMTLIKDMSETERQSWMTLIADVSVFYWFWQKMTYGRMPSFRIERYEPGVLLSIFITAIVLTIILHVVIASIFGLQKGDDDDEGVDERDITIQRKGAAYGFGFLAVAINIILGQMLLENTIEGYEFALSLNHMSHMFFVLMAITFIGDIIKNGVMVMAYRNA